MGIDSIIDQGDHFAVFDSEGVFIHHYVDEEAGKDQPFADRVSADEVQDYISKLNEQLAVANKLHLFIRNKFHGQKEEM